MAGFAIKPGGLTEWENPEFSVLETKTFSVFHHDNYT